MAGAASRAGTAEAAMTIIFFVSDFVSGWVSELLFSQGPERGDGKGRGDT